MVKFELRKIKYFDAMSEETPCFTAEIWEKGKLVAYAKNEGHGGGNYIYQADGLKYQDVAKFDDIDVECEIFGRVWEDFDVRRLQSKNFVIKKDDKIYTTKFPMSITKLKKHKDYATWKDGQIKKHSKDGYEVLNRNL